MLKVYTWKTIIYEYILNFTAVIELHEKIKLSENYDTKEKPRFISKDELLTKKMLKRIKLQEKVKSNHFFIADFKSHRLYLDEAIIQKPSVVSEKYIVSKYQIFYLK